MIIIGILLILVSFQVILFFVSVYALAFKKRIEYSAKLTNAAELYVLFDEEGSTSIKIYFI